MEQVGNVSRLPFVFRHVAVMPDVHLGMGSTIGCVIPTLGAVMPAAVGVDIGCGMMTRKLDLTRADITHRLPDIRAAIERAVPMGRTDDGRAGDRGAWTNPPEGVQSAWSSIVRGYEGILRDHPGAIHRRPLEQLATLGTGNHFIEVCVDPDDGVWLLLHSGSRGPGNRIGSYFTKLAQELCKRWFVSLPHPDLAYLPAGTSEYNTYVEAVMWAQEYAMTNRELMADAALRAVESVVGRPVAVSNEIKCHHNFVAEERHFGQTVLLTRKGAVRAREGDWGIIPGSMGAATYIVRGLGNRESFESCSHGAGRVMSRTAAKRQFSVADQIRQTEGVECRKDAEVIDEIPAAYKDIEAVMAAQADLVEPVTRLKQLVCCKG